MNIPVLRTKNKVEHIHTDDILFFSAEDKYIWVHTQGNRYRLPSSLLEWQRVLSGYEMLHRSKLVKMNQVASYDPATHTVSFRDSDKVCSVSRRNRHKINLFTAYRDEW